MCENSLNKNFPFLYQTKMDNHAPVEDFFNEDEVSPMEENPAMEMPVEAESEEPVEEQEPVEEEAEDAEEDAEEEGDEEDAEEEAEEFTNFDWTFSIMEFVKRLLKYLVEGIVVAIAAYTIPQKKLNLQDIAVIGLSAAATFALLDLFAPTISYAARQGAGFGVGANLVGFPRGL